MEQHNLFCSQCGFDFAILLKPFQNFKHPRGFQMTYTDEFNVKKKYTVRCPKCKSDRVGKYPEGT
jgi:hypothetical protein